MTIDSKYFPETIKLDLEVDHEYPFSLESIGGATINALFKYCYEDDCEVYVPIDAADYTLTYGGEDPIYRRGTFTFADDYDPALPPTATDEELYVMRDTTMTQELDLVADEPTPTESIEFALDKLTLILQEIDGEKCSCPYGGTEADPNDPEPPPPETPTCMVYECSALDDALLTEGLTRIYDLSRDNSFAWPFGTSKVSGQKGAQSELLPLSFFTSSPTAIPDWGSLVSKQNMTGWSWYGDAQDFVQCGNTTTVAYCVNINYPGGGANFGVATPVDDYVAAQGYTVNIVFTGYQGGDNADIDITSVGKANYNAYSSGGVFVARGATNSLVRLNTDVSGGQHTLSLRCGTSGAIGYNTTDMVITALGGQWFNLTVTATEWPDIIERPTHPGTGQMSLQMNTTLKATLTHQDGTVQTASVTGYNYLGTNIVSYALTDNTTIYNSPSFFYTTNGNITIAALAYGSGAQANHTLISNKFLQNLTTYEDPDPECIPP